MKLLRNGGLLVLIPFPPTSFHISTDDLVFRRIRVAGSLIGSNKATKNMCKFVVENDIKAKLRTYPFSKVNLRVEDYHLELEASLSGICLWRSEHSGRKVSLQWLTAPNHSSAHMLRSIH
jgi:propanol-preferring alcohol dehydrogenase